MGYQLSQAPFIAFCYHTLSAEKPLATDKKYMFVSGASVHGCPDVTRSFVVFTSANSHSE
jgi:hypothetical protein